MYCRKCGAKNEDDATNCYSCGQALLSFQAYQQQMAQRQNNQQLNNQQPNNEQPNNQQQTYQPQNFQQQRPYYAPNSVPNYLVWSILAALFCCQIPGIVGIVYAAQVNGKLAAGDYRGAVDASNSARTWTLVAFGLGLAGSIIYGILLAMGMMAQR